MKKVLLTISLVSIVAIANSFAGVVTVTIKGTKVGTGTSTTVNSDGSVKVTADCENSLSDCASATIETKDTKMQQVEVKMVESNGNVNVIRGIRTADMAFYHTANSLEIDMFLVD